MLHSWRFFVLVILMLLGTTGLVGRMLDLCVINRAFLVKQSEARVIRTIDIPAHRGMLTDRNGVPLAISAPVDSVWANPQVFQANSEQLKQLGIILNNNPQDILQKIGKARDREFVYLARSLSPETAAKIAALKIKGIAFQREYRRFYPSGEVTAHVLGFTNIDDQGQEGLELAYNDYLQGVIGKRQVVKDRLGQIVSDLGVLRPPQEGHDLSLSIDSRIQYLAYTALQTAVPKFNAQAGSIVVLNVNTGEILAMTNVPSYNPNARSIRDDRYRNRAITDQFEPGSTMKAFSVASALASGKYTANSTVDTNPGRMSISGHTISDHENYGIINLTQILQKSSNIGAAKITLSLPPQNLYNFLSKMGFGERTDSGFPGEATGSMVKERIRRPANLATMAYGYGLSATALQLTQAYAIFATHGIKKPVTFVKISQPPVGKPVIDRQLADQMLVLLKAVAEGGSGLQARIQGYQIGGKTGTAYILGSNGYQKNHYTSSFIGIAPLSNPQLVVAVILHDVKGNMHFGAQVSAPIFANVMGGALRYLNIAPDNLADNLAKADSKQEL